MNSFSDNGQVPLFDRFFLGGPDSLRGFSYRKIGPTDSTGEPLGGKTYEFFSFEYAFQVAKPVQLVTFYDWGVLNGPSAAFNPNNYNDNYGIGIRILLYGAPLRLDYGVPITSSQYNKNSGRFWFSFGTRF
jgi:outer membrane protein insertion porin family